VCVVVWIAIGVTQHAQIRVTYLGREASQPRIADPWEALFSRSALAIGIPPLSNASLLPATREIRITDNYPPVCCIPIPMLRIVDNGQGNVEGELLLVRQWHRPETPVSDEKCVANGQSFVCVKVGTLSQSADWRKIAKVLDDLGAWTISEVCSSPGEGIVTDSGDLMVQRLIGDRFSYYWCNAVSLHSSSAARKAAAIRKYVFDLIGPIPAEYRILR